VTGFVDAVEGEGAGLFALAVDEGVGGGDTRGCYFRLFFGLERKNLDGNENVMGTWR